MPEKSEVTPMLCCWEVNKHRRCFLHTSRVICLAFSEHQMFFCSFCTTVSVSHPFILTPCAYENLITAFDGGGIVNLKFQTVCEQRSTVSSKYVINQVCRYVSMHCILCSLSLLRNIAFHENSTYHNKDVRMMILQVCLLQRKREDMLVRKVQDLDLKLSQGFTRIILKSHRGEDRSKAWLKSDSASVAV